MGIGYMYFSNYLFVWVYNQVELLDHMATLFLRSLHYCPYWLYQFTNNAIPTNIGGLPFHPHSLSSIVNDGHSDQYEK